MWAEIPVDADCRAPSSARLAAIATATARGARRGSAAPPPPTVRTAGRRRRGRLVALRSRWSAVTVRLERIPDAAPYRVAADEELEHRHLRLNRFRAVVPEPIHAARRMRIGAGSDDRRVRLRDVAERAGVSVGSASQAFGRPDLVSEDVRARVLAAAEELGYPGPHPGARRLRTGRAGAVGLIFAERLAYQFTDPASPPFLRGVALAMHGTPTGLLLIPDSRQREESARTVSEAAVDGFLIYSAAAERPARRGCARAARTGRDDRPAPRHRHPVRRDRRPHSRAQRRGAPPRPRPRARRRARVRHGARSGGKLQLDLSIERLEGYRAGLGERWNPEPRPHRPPERRRAGPRGDARAAARAGSADGDPRHERHPRARRARGRRRAAASPFPPSSRWSASTTARPRRTRRRR